MRYSYFVRYRGGFSEVIAILSFLGGVVSLEASF
jgi:hypothetical protein